jgi:Carboxypeptidase regulatory-like domain/TonB dependent receptor/TonB-dependent Receptor Plug Domain
MQMEVRMRYEELSCGSIKFFAFFRSIVRIQIKARPLLALPICLCFSALSFTQSFSQETNGITPEGSEQQANQANPKIEITVLDENGVPVPAAQLTLVRADTQAVVRGETDSKGRHRFSELTAGMYRVKIEKQGFYASDSQIITVGQIDKIEITINHEQEVRDSVNVVTSPPTIDLAKTAAGDELSSMEVVNIPYTSGRDWRNVLPYVPGIVREPNGNVHINGAASNQINTQFDGFSAAHPANGLVELRVSPDALRSIDVKSSRYSAEYGKGSAGILGLTTGMGDDRYRFAITDFIPSPQLRNGINLSDWTPRATFSGPLRKQKAWFFNAFDGEYNLNIIDDLPEGLDRGRTWRVNNLSKAQVNLSPTNILSTSFLINRFNSSFDGLSQFNPIETTRNLNQSAYLFTVKDQAYFTGGMVLEFGFGANQYDILESPQGDMPEVRVPGSKSGNYFKTTEGLARRFQFIGNLTFPTAQWHGRHEFKLGTDIDQVYYQQLADRNSILIQRRDMSLSRRIDYVNNPAADRYNFEVSGYGQDRWSISDRWLMELGLRYDWDQIIRDVLISPRIATTYLLKENRDTKLSAGIGVYYDTTNLSYLTLPDTGSRLDYFYNTQGQPLFGSPIETILRANDDELAAPRFLNWSLGIEDKLPSSIYMRLDFIGRRGSRGFAFINNNPQLAGLQNGNFQLGSFRRDRYDAVQITLRRQIKQNYMVLLSYTRSNARSNATFEYDIDNPIFSQQAGGPLPWDSPNRLISWGWLPLIKGFDLSYALDWRDGFPFNIVNQSQQLVGPPNSMRFPDYFSLNVHAEKRFRLIGYHWAVRGGFNNLTNRTNPSAVDNNIDSENFLNYGGFQRRAFVGRIRFLGRK